MVATVSPQGVVTARGLGATAVTVITPAVSSGPIPVVVEPRFASIRVLAPSNLAHVGDTVAIHVDALDSAGNIVPGVQVRIIQESQIDSVLVFVGASPPLSPANSSTTPATFLYRVVQPGIAALGLLAPHVSVQPPGRIESVVVQASGSSA
jgi:hypothetical protein